VHIVKNMPSFSPKFRGFDFKQNFRKVFPRAKISAVADRAHSSASSRLVSSRLASPRLGD
jgi:hypothetical protein